MGSKYPKKIYLVYNHLDLVHTAISLSFMLLLCILLGKTTSCTTSSCEYLLVMLEYVNTGRRDITVQQSYESKN